MGILVYLCVQKFICISIIDNTTLKFCCRLLHVCVTCATVLDLVYIHASTAFFLVVTLVDIFRNMPNSRNISQVWAKKNIIVLYGKFSVRDNSVSHHSSHVEGKSQFSSNDKISLLHFCLNALLLLFTHTQDVAEK